MAVTKRKLHKLIIEELTKMIEEAPEDFKLKSKKKKNPNPQIKKISSSKDQSVLIL